ncbi:MAG: VOC family protein [Bacillota bacterium]|nr:VOC family protein [Bacillota bacterium]
MSDYKGELVSLLYTDNFESTVSFYEDILGLEKAEVWSKGGEKATKFKVAGGGRIQVTCGGTELPKGPISLWLHGKDINGVYESIKKEKGVKFLEPIEDKYYHARAFQMIDPSGNGVSVVAYENEVKPYTKDAKKADYFGTEYRSVFFVDDFDACFEFYTKVLGVECVYSWNESPEDRGCKYDITGEGAFLETLHRKPLLPQDAGSIMIRAKDVDATYKRISGIKGAKIISDIEDTERGTRQFSLNDPDGNVIIVFSYI